MDEVTRPHGEGAGPAGAAMEEAAPAAGAGGLLVADLLERLLGRAPRPRELEIWTERIGRIRNAENFLRALLQWRPLREGRPARTALPAGHAGSPVVDPERVAGYVDESRAAAERMVAGVPLSLAAMDAWWAGNRAVIAATPLAAPPAGPYGLGDRATLRAMMAARRPRRVIAVGAAAALPFVVDVAGELGLEVSLTAIDPAAAADGGDARITLIAGTVQGQPLAMFAQMQAGDILLVASTHVLKTGSDVHYILFHVLPVLAPGVLVQFSECRFPFEYSSAQIFEKNCSWNEAYALRALLMYSTRFRVLFSGGFFARHREEEVKATLAPLLPNPGSALWIEVVDDGGPAGLAAVGGIDGFSARVAAAGEAREAGAAVPRLPAANAGARLAPSARRRPDGPPMLRAEVAAEGHTVAFDIADGRDGGAFFALGVRKSGSTMFHRIVAALARANAVNEVNIPGAFFRNGLSVAAWARQDLSAMVRPGNVYTGFRTFPQRLAASAPYRGGRKVFMHRDPRDAIVSQYFSDAFSHSLPEESDTGARARFIEKRQAARGSDIDAWVLENAPSLGKAMEAFAPALADPSCRVFPYHAYVFEKRALIEEVLAHFGWSATAAEVAAILAEVDVRPQGEDPQRFVRKATPGDHRAKLKGETVAALDAIFARALATFGYA